MLRIVFLGTGRLAQPTFAALCDSAHQVVGLVTQPDRIGRGHHQHVNPLKELAQSRGIPVFQPSSIKTPESLALLNSWRADLFVVAAYGQILSKAVLETPRLGCVNVHASLLPKYRGATPIHAAVLNGDAETGVTIISLEPQLDAGPMLGVVRTPIGPKETTGELEVRLADLAVPLTLQVIDQLEAGTVQALIQDAAAVSKVGKLEKQDGRIPWGKSAIEVERHIRAMQPWPGSFTQLIQPNRPPSRIQILSADLVESISAGTPGEVIDAAPDAILVRCGSGAVAVRQLQPDGKRPMSAAEFLRGRKLTSADRFE
ncbi:MAG: methionyl-tRNA formyltransferase [Planctomycetaceae bacterium]